MRKFLVILAIGLTYGVSAQEDSKHNMLFNVSGGLSAMDNEINQLAGSLRIGTTNNRKLALGIDLGYMSLELNRVQIEVINVSPFLRIYPFNIKENGLFLGAEAGYGSFLENIENGRKYDGSGFIFGPELGLNASLTDQAALDFLVHFQKAAGSGTSFDDSWSIAVEMGVILFL